jgi:hypothetical protein
MNWSAVEAVSSAIGAVGVIVTIVYLAYQIRQNTQSIQGQTEQSLMSLERDVYALIADNANVYRRGSADLNGLDQDEALQFLHIVAAELSLIYSAYVQHQRRLISDEVWDAYRHGAQGKLDGQGYKDIWTELRHEYPVSFGKTIDQISSSAVNAI